MLLILYFCALCSFNVRPLAVWMFDGVCCTGGMSAGQIRFERNQWLPLIQYLQKRELLPVVIFSFSRKNASAAAFALSTLDMTSGQDKADIHMIFEVCAPGRMGRVSGLGKSKNYLHIFVTFQRTKFSQSRVVLSAMFYS